MVEFGGFYHYNYRAMLLSIVFLLVFTKSHAGEITHNPDSSCLIAGAVSDVSDLATCTAIYGDLILENVQVAEIDANITKVLGCIRIQNTKLENLDFLQLHEGFGAQTCAQTGQNLKSTISNNPSLCLTPRNNRLLQSKYQATIENNLPDTNCHKTCSSKTFVENYAELARQEIVCETLKGNFVVKQNFTVEPAWIKGLKSVSTIEDGTIEIFATNFVTVDWFSNLVEIKNPQQSYAIIIQSNPLLQTIVLSPKLKRVSIDVYNNDKLTLQTVKALKTFSPTGSRIQSSVVCGFSGELTDPAELEGCETVVSDLILVSPKFEKVEQNLTAVNGCLVIRDTKLQNLEFLKLAEGSTSSTKCSLIAQNSEVSGNKELCVFPRLENKMKRVFGATFTDNKDESCANSCSGDSFMEDIEARRAEEINCKTINGNMHIKHMKDDPTWQDELKPVTAVVNGTLLIENTDLVTINMFPNLIRVVPLDVKEPTIIIQNNQKLRDILMSPHLEKHRIIVLGNPNLNLQSIKTLKKHALPGSDFQSSIECGFTGPVEDPSDLEGCEKITSDLIITSPKFEKLPKNLRHVEGCLVIKNTNLENFHYDKLDTNPKKKCIISNQNSEVSGNKQLCILPLMQDYFKAYGATWSNNKNEICASTCDGATIAKDFEKIKDSKRQCKVINGNLEIKNVQVMPRWFELLKPITAIENGALIFEGNSIADFDMLPNLARISNNGAGGSGPAIIVRNNAILAEIDLPALNKLEKNGDGKAVVIEKNPRLKLSSKLKTFFEKQPGGLTYDAVGEPKDKEKKSSARGQKMVVGLISVVLLLCK